MMSSLMISKSIFIRHKFATTISFVNFDLGLALEKNEVSNLEE